jgi:GntR family transcriptional regulator/MocR family aminotransferase
LYSIAPYYQRPPDRAGLLMGYAGMSVGEIEQAVNLFGGCVQETLARYSK